MNRASKIYAFQFALSMVIYGFAVIGSVLLLRSVAALSWRILLALVPVLPVGWGVWSFVRFLGHLDELQQRIQLHAIAFAAGGTGMLSFAYGFLELAGLPPISVLWVLPMLLGLWGVGVKLAVRRYS